MLPTCWTDNGGILLSFLIPSTVLLIFTSIIILISVTKLHKKVEIDRLIKWPYYVVCIFAVLTMLLAITLISMCHWISYFSTIFSICYLIEIFSVLQLLLSRVYLTFEESVFKMSKCQKMIVIISYIITMASAISIIVVWVIINEYNDGAIAVMNFYSDNAFLIWNQLLFGILYIGLTIYVIFIFIQKMLNMAELHKSSLKDVMDESAIELNKQQKILLINAARYISLLMVAMISGIINVLIFGSVYDLWNIDFDFHMNFARLMWSTSCLDCAINVTSLYLQFPFAKGHYNKYCCCLRSLCEFILARNAKKRMQQKYKCQVAVNQDEHLTTMTE